MSRVQCDDLGLDPVARNSAKSKKTEKRLGTADFDCEKSKLFSFVGFIWKCFYVLLSLVNTPLLTYFKFLY